MTIVIARPRTQPLLAWKYAGQPKAEWPSWVRGEQINGAIRHERRSGRQIVPVGEIFVKDLDGIVCSYTEDEFAREFAATGDWNDR